MKTVRDVIFNEMSGRLIIDGEFLADLNERLTPSEMEELLNRRVVANEAKKNIQGFLDRSITTIGEKEWVNSQY